MTRYRIEEEDDTPDFLIFLQIALFILFLPIGAIILIFKIIGWVSNKNRKKEIERSEMKETKMRELTNLASLRDKGLITEAEFQERRIKIIKHL